MELPVLLESFPAPPSFLPPTPIYNAPPSAPPSSPLPPIPGPSRISESDTLLILSASRRSSKFSLASESTGSSTHRDSISSSLSSHSHSLPSPRPPSPDIPTLLSRTPRPYRSRRSSTNESWQDASFDAVDLETEKDITSLQRHLDDHGSDSDSSLDLHTPLPHLMLRHGLLSPNSKLLTSTDGSSIPSSAASSRPGSVFSISSTADSIMTKSGVMKDSRDTPRRRIRHRDGKLLRGGIGLTTGLGWSDSEDEDAPSALTRKISNLNLARRSTPSLKSSLRSSSYSRSTFFEDDYDDDFTSHTFSGRSSVASRRSKTPSRLRTPSSLPPTSWGKKSSTPRTSLRSSDSGASTYSLALSISQESLAVTRLPKAHHEDIVRTPSTASSLSIPLPVTPQDDLPSSKTLPAPDRNKMLPSLPNPRTGSIRRYASHANIINSSLRGAETSPTTPLSGAAQRRRSQSSASSSGSPSAHESHSLPVTGLPRSLRLSPRSDAVPPLPTSMRQRSAVRAPITAPSTPTHSQLAFPSRPRISDPPKSSSISPLPAGIPVPRQRPRIGTGMVYRTSSAPRPMAGSSSSGVGIAL